MKIIRMTASEYRNLNRKRHQDAKFEAKSNNHSQKTKTRIVSPKEHEFQKKVVREFRKYGFQVYLMDAMVGVGYFSKDDPKRFAFINALKARGYEKGQPDICVIRNKVWFIELKRKNKGKASDEQLDIGDWLVAHGHNYALIDDMSDVARIIENPNN